MKGGREGEREREREGGRARERERERERGVFPVDQTFAITTALAGT
jgi:hypothetical protein